MLSKGANGIRCASCIYLGGEDGKEVEPERTRGGVNGAASGSERVGDGTDVGEDRAVWGAFGRVGERSEGKESPEGREMGV